MDSLRLLQTAASGMEAQRAVLDIEARNVAAAEAAGPMGSYPRLVPDFRIGASDGEAPVAVLNARAYESNASVFATI